MKKAAIYARFSSDLQRDQSIADQIALCRGYANRNGFQLAAEYSDAAKSGSSIMGRDGLLSLMADAQGGRFEVVITESLDRLGRDQEDLARIFKRLSFFRSRPYRCERRARRHGADRCPRHAWRTLPSGSRSQNPRGLAGKVAEGKSAGGKAYGYRPVKGEPGNLEIIPEEAEIVWRIYREYAAGKSHRQIARDLNRDRIPAPRGSAWAANTLNGTRNKGTGMLRVPIYRGLIVWNKVHYVRDPSTGRL